jgi:dienelactone hydrolase
MNAVPAIILALALTAAPQPVTAPVIGAPAGTGRWPAVAEARADAPGYTLYRPAQWPDERLPLVLWGNGGCRNNGLSASHFLREIASHGYLVIANGAPREERPVLASLPPANGPRPAGAPPPRATADETQTSQLLGAIDWVMNSDLALHVDTARIAVMGHSCGGLQALAAAADPRIDAVIAFNSGVYIRAGSGLSGVDIVKDDLRKLHTPVAYILGGPDDIAYPNGSDDVRRIAHVPVFFANAPVGHGGTFGLANGGDYGRIGVAWLDWQLKGSKAAGAMFVGANCGLCKDPTWTIVRKQFPEDP